MSAKLPDGWKVKRTVDEKGEHFEILPPDVTDAVMEVIGMAIERLVREYLTGKRAWEDFPEESRPWLCHLYLRAIDEMVAAGKRNSPNRMAERGTDVLLALDPESVKHLDPRLASDDEEKRLAAARTVSAKHFKAKRSSLKRTHARKRRGDKKG